MSDEYRYLQDILENLYRIDEFTTEGYDSFVEDEKTQYAVIRAYEIIGEAAKRLSRELLAQRPSVNWQQIKGFRDFLIHSYDKVDLSYLWAAVEDISTLRTAVIDLLNYLDSAQPNSPEEP